MIKNRATRQRIAYLKFKKRCKALELDVNKKINHYFYAQGKPCSCYMCKGERYSRKLKHKNTFYEKK